MNGETLSEVTTSVLMVLLMVGLGWTMKAAAAGKIKRNPWVGIRTPALMHCDECWLLGHHAACHKSTLGCWLAAAVIAAGGFAALLAPNLDILQPASWLLGMVLLVGGILLGLRDANTMVAKMHREERIDRS